MRKAFLLGVLSMAALTAQAYFVGYVHLDNVDSQDGLGGPVVTYPAGFPANGISGVPGVPGTGLSSDWVAGIYYAPGDINLQEPFGYGMPDPRLTLATGSGSTAQFATVLAYDTPGEFSSVNGLNVGGYAGDLITAEVVVYPAANGSYANSLYRMHSASFTMPTAAAVSPDVPSVGDYMPVFPVPEPGEVALVSMGLAALLLASRKKPSEVCGNPGMRDASAH